MVETRGSGAEASTPHNLGLWARGLIDGVEAALVDALAAAAAAVAASAASLTAVQLLQAHPDEAQRPSPEEARHCTYFPAVLPVEDAEVYLRGFYVYRELLAAKQNPYYAEGLQVLGYEPEKELLVCCWLCCSEAVREARFEEVLWYVDASRSATGSHTQRLVSAFEEVLGEDLQELQGCDAFLDACLGNVGA